MKTLGGSTPDSKSDKLFDKKPWGIEWLCTTEMGAAWVSCGQKTCIVRLYMCSEAIDFGFVCEPAT